MAKESVEFRKSEGQTHRSFAVKIGSMDRVIHFKTGGEYVNPKKPIAIVGNGRATTDPYEGTEIIGTATVDADLLNWLLKAHHKSDLEFTTSGTHRQYAAFSGGLTYVHVFNNVRVYEPKIIAARIGDDAIEIEMGFSVNDLQSASVEGEGIE